MEEECEKGSCQCLKEALTGEATTYTSTWTCCNHENGWFQSVKFFFLKYEVFACIDCESLIDAKTVRKIQSLLTKKLW